MWTIGHVVPAHTQKLKSETGFGLGLGTTQGREGKVVQVKRYLEHSTPATKNRMLFRHEYMHLVWLAKHDPHDGYHATKNTYLPAGFGQAKVCHCGEKKAPESSSCTFCSQPLRKLVMESTKVGKCLPALQHIINPHVDCIRPI